MLRRRRQHRQIGNAGGHSVWWSWTAPAIGTVRINTDRQRVLKRSWPFNNAAGSIAISNLTCVSYNNGATRAGGLASLKFNVPTGAQVGTTYKIALDGYNGQAGNAVFNFAFTKDTTPPKVLAFSPANGAVLTNSSVLVTGTASDNVAVASVQCRLANAGGASAWQLAATTNSGPIGPPPSRI